MHVSEKWGIQYRCRISRLGGLKHDADDGRHMGTK